MGAVKYPAVKGRIFLSRNAGTTSDEPLSQPKCRNLFDALNTMGGSLYSKVATKTNMRMWNRWTCVPHDHTATTHLKVCCTVHLVPPLLLVSITELVIHSRKGTLLHPSSNHIENTGMGKLHMAKEQKSTSDSGDQWVSSLLKASRENNPLVADKVFARLEVLLEG